MPACYYFRPVVVEKSHGADLVLLNLDCGTAFRLNGTGRRVWELLKEARSVDDIGQALADTFPISLHQADQDARFFLNELVRNELVDMVPGEEK